MWYLQGFIVVVLICIAWQDFKFRAVYWWLFVFLFITLAALKVTQSTWQQLYQDLGFNSIFVGVQMLFLSLYFAVKERKLVNIFKTYFGLGDLLFLLCMATYFSFFNYIAFYIISLFVVILVSLVQRVLVQNYTTKIPLAGAQAMLVVFCLVVEATTKLTWVSDLGLMNYLGL